MNGQDTAPIFHGRRTFLKTLTLAGAAGIAGLKPGLAGAEPPPETTRLRLPEIPGVCTAPTYVAEELLRTEGFSDVQYVKAKTNLDTKQTVASGKVDMYQGFVTTQITRIDAGAPAVMLAGIHPGCLELFAAGEIRTIRELKGKTVSVDEMAGSRHLFLVAIMSHVGLDSRRDIKWIEQPREEGMRSLAEGKVDALMTSPPEAQELRAKKVGRLIASTTTDRPWSQYFCCVLMGNREFVRKHPIATKRALRAFLKATELCGAKPEQTAHMLAKRGLTKNYDYAVQALRELPYARWRDFDAEDSMRYYALRLQEAGYIKSSAKKIVAEGSDWRFLNELKRELKG